MSSMDDFLSRRREIFFNNLVLLGFDRLSYEKKYGIPFHKDMFILPNKKGFEIVTHFLFSKLNSVTGKDYNIPWPLLDKEHERLFQKTCYAHLTNFSQENLVKFPRMVPSLLSAFGNDRFYAVNLAFSSYVLSKTIKKTEENFLAWPILIRESFHSAKDILQLSTVIHMQKFRYIQSLSHSSYLAWTKIAKNSEECLQKLEVSVKADKEKQMKNKRIVSSLYSLNSEENLSLKKIIEKCLEYGRPKMKERKILESFFLAENTFWQYLASEVGENVANNFLDGQIYNICISNQLPKVFCQYLEKMEFSSSKENGKLSVARFMNLFMAYVTCLTKLLTRDDLNPLYEKYFLENSSHTQVDLLNTAEKLNQKLDKEILPDVGKSIKELKLITCFEDTKEQPEFSGFLPVKSFNPVIVKQRTTHFNPALAYLPYLGTNMCNAEDGMTGSVLDTENHATSNPSVSTSVISSFHQQTDCTTSMLAGKALITHVTNENKRSDNKYSKAENMPVEDSFLSSTKMSTADLSDIDLAPSSHFKMRQSWLQEESLNSMSLPDLSFDE